MGRGALIGLAVGVFAIGLGTVSFGLQTDDRSEDEPPTEVTLPDGASPLARRSFEAMDGFAAFESVVEVTDGDTRCRQWGPDHWRTETSADGRCRIVDVGDDDTTDVIVDGDAIYLASEYVPDWRSPTDWVGVRLRHGEPNPMASATLRLEPTLWITTNAQATGPSTMVATFERDLEGRLRPSDVQSHGDESLTAYSVEGGVALSPFTLWLDAEAVVRRVDVRGSTEDDPTSYERLTSTFEGRNGPLEESTPSPADVTELADLEAADVVPSLTELIPACEGGEVPIDAYPTSLRAELYVADDLTFGEYADLRFPVGG